MAVWQVQSLPERRRKRLADIVGANRRPSPAMMAVRLAMTMFVCKVSRPTAGKRNKERANIVELYEVSSGLTGPAAIQEHSAAAFRWVNIHHAASQTPPLRFLYGFWLPSAPQRRIRRMHPGGVIFQRHSAVLRQQKRPVKIGERHPLRQ